MKTQRVFSFGSEDVWNSQFPQRYAFILGMYKATVCSPSNVFPRIQIDNLVTCIGLLGPIICNR